MNTFNFNEFKAKVLVRFFKAKLFEVKNNVNEIRHQKSLIALEKKKKIQSNVFF